MIDISKHYGTLTAPERLKLAVDAMARQDWQEVGTLGETCPTFKYNEQRDITYTGKFLDLQSMVLMHTAFFWRQRGAMQAAYMLNLFMPSAETTATYRRRRAELMAMIEAWARFCDYAGFDPDTVFSAFGLELDPMFDEDMQYDDIEPDESEIEANYQQHVNSWG